MNSLINKNESLVVSACRLPPATSDLRRTTPHPYHCYANEQRVALSADWTDVEYNYTIGSVWTANYFCSTSGLWISFNRVRERDKQQRLGNFSRPFYFTLVLKTCYKCFD